jgi:hypothetical protein
MVFAAIAHHHLTGGGFWSDLDKHSGSIQALTSIVLLIVTAVYVALTSTMARVARNSLRPYVYVDLEFHLGGNEALLTIGNSGLRAAERVKVTLISSSDEAIEQKIGELPIASGVGHLAPGTTRRYSVRAGRDHWWPSNAPATVLVFRLECFDGHRRRPIREILTIDAAGYMQSLVPGYGDPIEDVVSELRNISRNMPEQQVTWPEPKKACRYCGTRIASDARKCPACLEWQSARPLHKRINSLRPGLKSRGQKNSRPAQSEAD